MKMDWYVAKLVYQVVRNEPHTPEFDVQLRLIRADERDWAIEKANTIGRLEETVLKGENKRDIEWKFCGVTELVLVGDMDDATLLYTQTEEPQDENLYKSILKSRISMVNSQSELPIHAH